MTYHFVSDGTVPEPNTMLLLSLGLVALGWRRHAHERSGSVLELQT